MSTTPRPWMWASDEGSYAVIRAKNKRDVMLVYAEYGYSTWREFPNPTDEKFLIRAVNAHDALVGALREVLDHAEDSHVPRIGNQCTLCLTYREKIRAALKLAEPQP